MNQKILYEHIHEKIQPEKMFKDYLDINYSLIIILPDVVIGYKE